LFLIHPSITKSFLAIFSCQNIDGVNRVFDDLEIICYSPYHSRIAFGVALPSIILWSIGIPAFGLFLIYKKNSNNQLVKEKKSHERYGFLYHGYRVP
jgi:hypothetical protein